MRRRLAAVEAELRDGAVPAEAPVNVSDDAAAASARA